MKQGIYRKMNEIKTPVDGVNGEFNKLKQTNYIRQSWLPRRHKRFPFVLNVMLTFLTNIQKCHLAL